MVVVGTGLSVPLPPFAQRMVRTGMMGNRSDREDW
jgi:hypothetical protein